eukprot:7380491-Prymnesium_polylepis.2
MRFSFFCVPVRASAPQTRVRASSECVSFAVRRGRGTPLWRDESRQTARSTDSPNQPATADDPGPPCGAGPGDELALNRERGFAFGLFVCVLAVTQASHRSGGVVK